MSYKVISHKIHDKVFRIYKIKEVWTRERFFCILDKDKPYEIGIKYKELNKDLSISPIIGGHGGFVVNETMNENKIYMFRFAHKQETEKHKEEILLKQLWISEIIDKLNSDLEKDLFENKNTLTPTPTHKQVQTQLQTKRNKK